MRGARRRANRVEDQDDVVLARFNPAPDHANGAALPRVVWARVRDPVARPVTAAIDLMFSMDDMAKRPTCFLQVVATVAALLLGDFTRYIRRTRLTKRSVDRMLRAYFVDATDDEAARSALARAHARRRLGGGPSSDGDLAAIGAAARGDVSIIGASEDGRRLLVHDVVDAAPAAYVLYDRVATTAQVLFYSTPALFVGGCDADRLA